MCEMFYMNSCSACLLGLSVPKSPAFEIKRTLHALQLPCTYYRFLSMRAQNKNVAFFGAVLHCLKSRYSKTSSNISLCKRGSIPIVWPPVSVKLRLKSRSGPSCAQPFLFWSLFLLRKNPHFDFLNPTFLLWKLRSSSQIPSLKEIETRIPTGVKSPKFQPFLGPFFFKTHFLIFFSTEIMVTSRFRPANTGWSPPSQEHLRHLRTSDEGLFAREISNFSGF